MKNGVVSTGINSLDKKINGGFPDKTVVLLSGDSGTGKTLFGLNFLLEGAKKNERGVYISLNEDKEELARAANSISNLSALNNYVGKKVVFEYIQLGKMIDLDYFVKIFSSYPSVDRLVIDNVNKLLLFSENKKEYRTSLSEMIKILKNRVKCSLLLCETLDHTIDTGNGESYECDGVININFLEVEERPKRMLSVYKMRYTNFEERIPYELIISDKEIKMTSTRVI